MVLILLEGRGPAGLLFLEKGAQALMEIQLHPTDFIGRSVGTEAITNIASDSH